MTDPNGREKYRSRENRLKVRDIFLAKWDPIGVGNEAPDEYDTYVNRVYTMMMSEGATVQDVTAYLHGIAADHMMLPETPISWSKRTAEAVFALKAEFQRPLQ